MGAGQLRERITVLTPAPGIDDGQGGLKPSLQPDTETAIYARVQALKGTSQLALGAVAGSQLYTITIRANGPATIAVNTRLRWREVTMTVNSVAPGERRDLLTLTCTDNGRH